MHIHWASRGGLSQALKQNVPTCVGINLGNKGDNQRGVVELHHLVSRVKGDDAPVLTQPKLACLQEKSILNEAQ